MTLQEDPEISCRVLAARIRQPEYAILRPLLTEDFFTKCAGLPPDILFARLQEVLAVHLSPPVAALLQRLELSNAPALQPGGATVVRQRVDVALLAVIPEELAALKGAFGILSSATEHRYVNGFRYWLAEIRSVSQGADLKIVVSMVGEARNTPCALACTQLFQSFDVGLCILTGIAAGLEGFVTLGDVVAAEAVLDFEGQRIEPGGTRIRPVQYHPKRLIERDLQNFTPTAAELKAAILEMTSSDAGAPLSGRLPSDFNPNLAKGVILSGEKLLADGTLPEMRTLYHERVRALEMEGSGFARACDENGVPWLIFRGISDYGDIKKPASQNWQLPAAVAAATCARLFLRSAYRKPVF